MNRLPLIVFSLTLASCNREVRKVEKTVTPVRVAAVELFTPKTGERYSASIMPYRQVNLSFRVGGFVDFLHQVRGADGRMRNLEPGDVVPEATLLARLREEDYTLQVNQAKGQLDAARESEQSARAQVAQAQVALTKADADFTRAKALIETQSLTRPDYDAAKAQHDAAVAQVDAARAQMQAASARIVSSEAALASARLALRDTALTAPFAAAVVQRNVELGALTGSSSPAFSMADLSSVKASFGVPDSVAIQLKPGTAVSIFVEALPDRNFRGTVITVSAVADSNTRLFLVEVGLPNLQALLRPGMIGTLFLGQSAPAKPVPVVPLSAVIRDRQGGSSFAVMVVDGKVARTRGVTLGPTYGDRLALTAGVKPGEKVISTGATLVADGETVEVIP